MKAIVIYHSQTGFTAKYAQWIANDLGCEALPYANRRKIEEESYDIVVFCGWFHAASIKGASWFKSYMATHAETHFVVLAVGATPPPCEKWPAAEIEEAFRKTFPSEQYPTLPWFYCQGGFDFNKLCLSDKIAMRMFFGMLEKKAANSKRDAEALESMKRGFDATSRNALSTLFAHLHEHERSLHPNQP